MHVGTPLTDGYSRDAQLFCQPFAGLLILYKNYFDSIKRSFAHLYLIKTECEYNKIQFLHQRIIEKMVLNGGKLSYFAQIQYYWRILQSYFCVNLYRKELCNDKFYNIAIGRYAISIAAFLNSDPGA